MIIFKNPKNIILLIFIILLIILLFSHGCKGSQTPSEDLIKMELIGIRVEAATMIPVILLKEKEGDRYLPIWIGMAEAYSIALEMTKTEYIRPLTHDLIVTIIYEFGAKPEYIVVKDFENDIFYADIYLRKSLIKRTVIDCRPSDAIAIALRSDCEIYVAPHVLDSAGIEVKSPELEFKEL
jgi:bifunctional DNase/RNase